MTQEDLACRVRSTPRNITRWENNRNVPRPNTVARLADATGQPVESLHSQGPAGVLDDPELVADLMSVLERLTARNSKAAA